MQVLAALGDAPTAAIAVLAILVGVLLAARGPREKRAAGDAGAEEQPGPTLLKLPVADTPAAEPGFVGPEGEVVGHGPIRLGGRGPLGTGAADEPAPVQSVTPEPEPEPESEPEPEPEPAPVAHSAPEPEPLQQTEPAPQAPEAPLFASPPALPEAPALPQPAPPAPDATTEPPAEPPPSAKPAEPAEPKEPAWRVAARAANSAVHFRQGAIKLGGKPAKKDE